VTGLDASAIGAVAFENGIPLDELSPRRASLEAAFMELTRDSVEFRAGSGSASPATDITELARELAGKAQ
jgi:ABC-2 type transport system ATP-binding protein